MTRQKHRRKKRNVAASAVNFLKMLEPRVPSRHEIHEIRELIEYLRKLYA